MILIQKSRFAPGQMVVHRTHGYMGLIFDVDPVFTPDGLNVTLESQADKPWYHLLVDDEDEPTYVSEDELEGCEFSDEFFHPLMNALFEHSGAGDMITRYSVN